MAILRIGIVLIAALGLSGCGAINEKGHFALSSTRAEAASDQPVDPRKVQLVAGSPKAIYTPIREIEVTVNKLTMFHKTPDENDVRAALQAEAARIGGTAVIQVDISRPQISPLSWGARTGTGLVVRF